MGSRFTLSRSEQDELRKCAHVRTVSARTVQFTAEFKKMALKEYARGLPPDGILREAGIPAFLLKNGYAKSLMKRWRKVKKVYGECRFESENRGRAGIANLVRWHDKRKGYSSMSDKEKIAYLETQVEALEQVRSRFQLPLPPHIGAHNSRRRKNAGSSPA